MKKYLKIITILSLISLFCNTSISQNKQIVVGLENSKVSPSAHRYAIIIGNDHYKDEAITNLSSCRIDAYRMKHFFSSEKNWQFPQKNVSLILDVSKETFKAEFEKILNRIEKPEISTFYFYFSGHGVQGGIVPVDFKTKEPENIISYDWILSKVKQKQIKASVFIIDACYSGSILKYKNTSFDLEYWKNTQYKNSEMITVFTATNAYRVTASGKHESVYTKAFLEAVENVQTDLDKNGVIYSGELFKKIKKRLEEHGVPQFYGNTNFPMAKTSENKFESTAVDFTLSGAKKTIKDYSHLIEWKQNIIKNENDKNAILKTIQSLKQEGTPDAYSKIGYLYRKGIGVDQDFNTAISYFASALENNDSFAKYNLGVLYLTGQGFSKNIEKGILYMEDAANQGNPYAQYIMGIMYFDKDNKYVAFNYDTAKYWLEKATLYNLDLAHFSLGQLYLLSSKDVEKKLEKEILEKKAFKCFVKAATMSNSRAQVELANLYEKGTGTKINKLLAKEWLKRACKNNELQACRRLITIQEDVLITNN